jgi:hypothetical protein
MYIDNPKIPIQIYEWKSQTVINKPITINTIYRDDQIEVAIKKILNYFQYSDIYLWTDDEIIEFEPSIKFNNINPFLFDTNQDTNKLIINEKKGLFLFSKINIVNIETFKDNKKIKDVFFKYKRPNVTINEQSLNKLYDQVEESNIESTIITYYEFDTHVNLTKTLKYYYRKNTYDYDILLWVYDNYNKHITVKNNKDYSVIISELDNIVYENEELIIIKYLSNIKSYYKIIINNEGYVYVKLYLGNKIKYSIENVLKLKEEITKYFKSNFKLDTIFNDLSLKAQTTFKVPNFSKDVFIEKSALVYNFINKQDNFYIYNRTSNNKQSYDIESYIKELYTTLTKDVNIIVSVLLPQIDVNATKSEILEFVNNVINNEQTNLTKTKKIIFTQKTFFTINKTDNYYISITVNNIKSILELGYFNFWLSKITYNSKSVKKIQDKSKQSSSDSSKKSSSNGSLISDDPDGSSDSLGSFGSLSGGMPAKNAQIKQLNTLQILDPNLFNKSELYNSKTYAQNCQGNRQPMGLTNKKFEQHKDNVDNYLSINNNTYFCPRYWCPISEKPILDKTKATCDNKDEVPIDLYATKKGTFNKPDTPHYVAYYNVNYLKPCCYLKNKQVVLKTDKSSDKSNKSPDKKDNKGSAKSDKKDNSDKTDKTDNSASNIHIYKLYTKEIPEGRYGLLPSSILKLIDNKSPGLSCSDKLKSKQCAFRMGMKKSNSDLMDILTFLLNYDNRYDLVKAIYNKLDLIKFISLENGEIVREFMKKAIYKNERKLDTKVLKKTYNININALSLKNVHYAFNEFIDYLKNGKVTNPHYLYSIIAMTMNCNIYIWKYKNETNFHLLNPLYVNYADLKILSGNEKAINIFYNFNMNIFEPIVLKSTNDINYIFDFSNKKYDNLRNIEIESKIDINILDKIREYVAFYKLQNDYNIKIILLNNNLSVNHFVLNNNSVIKVNIIEPILLNKLIEIINCKEIQLYDELMYTDNFIKTLDFKNKYNFEVIHSKLKPQLFDNSILYYNTVTLHSETKNNKVLEEEVDIIYENNNVNSIFKHEIENHNNMTDWYNSYNFNNTFMTDNISYIKGKYSFSSKAIEKYKEFFRNKHKTEIIKISPENIKVTENIKLDLEFTKGQLDKLRTKWNSYNFYFVKSLNYKDDDIFDLLTKIMKIDRRDEIKLLTVNNMTKLFGSLEGFNLLCYILNYKTIICNILKLAISTPVVNIYDKFKKSKNITKEENINNIIPKLKTSEIHLFSATELYNIVIIVIHHRVYNSLNKDKLPVKRNSIEDIGETCNMFINNTIKTNYDKYPLLIIYSDDERLYFVDKQFYTKINEAPENIKEIIKYKIKTYKDLV